MAALVVMGVLGVGLARRQTGVGSVVVAGAVLVTVNLAWLLPGLLNGADQSADAAGAEAFAARADTPFGLGGSLLTLGALWKASIDPPERSSVVLAGLALGLTCVALAGLVCGWRRVGADRGLLVGLAAPAALTLVLAWWLSSEAGRPVMEWLITDVPGGGLARDAQKWVAPFALLLAVGFGEAVGWLHEHLAARPRGVSPSAAYAAALVPVLLLPSLAWGLLGHLRLSTYPDEWTQVAALLDEAGAADDRVRGAPVHGLPALRLGPRPGAPGPGSAVLPGPGARRRPAAARRRAGRSAGRRRTRRASGRRWRTAPSRRRCATSGCGGC